MVLVLGAARLALTQCGSLGPGSPEPNVIWGLKDSVASCPAGDSLLGVSPPRPSRLRIGVYYFDLDQCPKVGVPPESIWVTTSIVTGNLRVNDAAQKTYADDSTDVNGYARITLQSFSGCGKVAVTLRVSGAFKGTRHATVRTTDPDGDGRMETSESALHCDLNYSDPFGNGDVEDIQIAIPHVEHWHRNALFGTLVRRTNYCETCPGFAPNISTNTWPKESGGSDQILAVFTVVAPLQQTSAVLGSALSLNEPDGPNPTRGRFAITAPLAPGISATLEILDVSGRMVAAVRGPSGSQLVWDGKDQAGRLAAPGIYLYRMEVGKYRKEGSVVVLR